ncbi:hypothetical protein DPEC_G00035840, partial [Dallia pectoralis]
HTGSSGIAWDRQPGRQTARQTDSQADRQPGRQTARQTDSQADRQPGRQTARQTDSQADRQESRRVPAHSMLHTAGEDPGMCEFTTQPVLRSGFQGNGSYEIGAEGSQQEDLE